MYKQTLYYDDRVSIIAEFDGAEVVFIHTYVHKFSKSLMHRLKEMFQDIKEAFYVNGFDYIFAYTQNVKFAEKMDPNYEVVDTLSARGKQYEVLAWDLTQ